MQAIEENVFYSPKFSNRATISVRRLSWYLKKPMTQVINIIVDSLPSIFNSFKVCNSCKEKSLCKYCAFSTPEIPPEQSKGFESQ